MEGEYICRMVWRARLGGSHTTPTGDGGAGMWFGTGCRQTPGRLTTGGQGSLSTGLLMLGWEEWVEEGDVGGVEVVGVAGDDG